MQNITPLSTLLHHIIPEHDLWSYTRACKRATFFLSNAFSFDVCLFLLQASDMNLAGINHPAFILFKAVHDDDLPRVQATLAHQPNLWGRARLVYGMDFVEPQATPLMVAIRRRRLAIAHWLIDHSGSADIDEKDTDGCTALHVACEFGLAGIVRALIGAGANPLLESCAGTPLSCAAGFEHIEAMEVLLELPRMRKNMNHVNDTLREYSLRGSALTCSNEVVECLLNAGATLSASTMASSLGSALLLSP